MKKCKISIKFLETVPLLQKKYLQIKKVLYEILILKYSKSPNDGFYFDEEKFMSEWNIWKNQDIKKGCFLSKRYEIEYDPKFHYITYFKPITTVESDCILDTTEHEVMVSEFSITQSAE